MSSLVCIKAIIWGFTCAIAKPDAPEPQAFVYGSPHDKVAMEWAQRFNPQTPTKGLIISFRPEYKRPVKRVVARVKPKKSKQEPKTEKVAYASEGPRGFEKLIERIFGAKELSNPDTLYVKADGNEVMGCVHDNKFLMDTMRKMRRKWGKAVIVNSAYRSPSHNKRVRGAKNSYHMSCRALDVRIQGVGKDTLAAWLRRQPGMGGVGVYSSSYVHFDDGSRRDWDWR